MNPTELWNLGHNLIRHPVYQMHFKTQGNRQKFKVCQNVFFFKKEVGIQEKKRLNDKTE